MGSTRIEEQELTTKLVAVNMKKGDEIDKRRKWREERELREGVVRGKWTRIGRRGHTERRELAKK